VVSLVPQQEAVAGLAIVGRSGDRLIRENTIFQHAQPVAIRVFAALSDLLVDGKSVLFL
jgi:hypothetical protein